MIDDDTDLAPNDQVAYAKVLHRGAVRALRSGGQRGSASTATLPALLAGVAVTVGVVVIVFFVVLLHAAHQKNKPAGASAFAVHAQTSLQAATSWT